jgi:hypothetical protein
MEEDGPVKRFERQPLTQSATSRFPSPRGRAVGGCVSVFCVPKGDRSSRAGGAAGHLHTSHLCGAVPDAGDSAVVVGPAVEFSGASGSVIEPSP